MQTIKKRGADLVPGDIVVVEGRRRSVLATEQHANGVIAETALLDGSLLGAGISLMRLARIGWDADQLVQVEARELTPAQEHADELREMLWRAANFMRDQPALDGIEAEARELLAKIDPPKPPTLEEIVDVLAKVAPALAQGCKLPDEYARSIGELVDRARRAGVLK